MAAGASPPTSVRPPAVAGMFYPADAGRCRDEARSLLRARSGRVDEAVEKNVVEKDWIGAVVPHAGWICSGAIAGEAIAKLASGGAKPDVVVVFGAVHTPGDLDLAAFDSHEAWHVPGSDTELAIEAQRDMLRSSGGLFEVEAELHRHEHAVEVELPLIREAWPAAKLLPIEVPAIESAVEIGIRTAETLAGSGKRVVFLASSDLTHYGPSYGFTPAGVGEAALEWAKANDRRLLERVTDLAAEQIVPEARAHANACGAGAIAAMLAACRVCGATSARLLRHANSYETLAKTAPQAPTDAVGYAAVIIG